MTVVTLKKDFYTIPPQIIDGRWSTVNEAEYYNQQLKIFFKSAKGSRPLLPDYGFDFEFQGIEADELKALILAELRIWFSALTIENIEVIETDLGSFYVEIQFSFDDTVNSVTLTF